MGTDITKQLSYYIWAEKYRPISLDDVILPKEHKKFFKNVLKDKEIPNMIFHSVAPGVCKTSLSKVICNDLEANYRYINMSEKGGIDTLRNDINKFAAMKSLDGKPKIVILDEFQAPNATINLQNGLKAAIEEFKNSCRFILTTNFINSIIEPIKSRCMLFDFNFSEVKVQNEMKPLVADRISEILTFENIVFQEQTINKLVEEYFPDIRKMISICQQYSKMKGYIDNEIFKFDKVEEEFYDYVLNFKFGKARKYLIDRNYNYSELYRELYYNLVPRVDPSKQGRLIVTIAEYEYRHASMIDAEINASALIFEIISILSEKPE